MAARSSSIALARVARVGLTPCSRALGVPTLKSCSSTRSFSFASSTSFEAPNTSGCRAPRCCARPLSRHQSSSTSQVRGCPTCHEALPALSSSDVPPLAHCPSCSSFLPPPASDTLNFFSLFDLPVQFTIDKADLKKSFLKWQGRVHPDRLPHDGKGDVAKQQDWCKDWSSIVNEGYKKLLSDRTRGEYLLQRRGVQIEEQDKMEDPEMLMEILEVREALEEAETEEEMTAIRDQNIERNKGTLDQLKSLLDGPPEGLDVEEAKQLLIRLKYQDNVENVCKEFRGR